MKLIRYISGAMFLSLMTVMSSCTEELIVENPEQEIVSPEDDGMVDLTLNFNVNGFENKVTRADGTVSDLTLDDLENINLLVYALRDSKDNLLNQYGKGIVDEELEEKPALKGYDKDKNKNQTLMKVKWVKNQGENTFSLEKDITLRVMRGTVFKLTVWAQNWDCDAYDFNSFSAIKVDYSDANNNDETRDAFCAMTKFSIGQVESKVSITLTRPFAQINVGVKKPDQTSAEVSQTDEDDSNYNKYQYSEIQFSGVSKYFSLVNNRVMSQEDIKEYLDEINKNNKEDFSALSKDTDVVKIDGIDYPAATTSATFSYNHRPENSVLSIRNYAQTNWPTSYFWNLSTCYVLVPEPEIQLNRFALSDKVDPNPGEEIIYAPVVKDDQGNDVPLSIGVKRNWRTNILFDDWKKLIPETQR